MISALKLTAKRILPWSVINWIRARRHADEVAMIAHLCQPGAGTMVDVGAHFGSATGIFTGLGWRILAYEPDPKNRAEFQKRFSANPKIQLSTSAVSNEERSGVQFFSSEVSSGISGLSAFHDSHTPSATVDTVTLANDLRRRSVHQVDVLKVDVEGYDFFVLQGFDWSLKPRFVIYEFEDRKTKPLGYNLDDSASYVINKGYHVAYSVWEPISEYGTNHTWRGLYREPPKDANDCWGNVICFSEVGDLETCMRRFANR